jgi:CopG family transcriptional regulator, nickel-responsive regulator
MGFRMPKDPIARFGVSFSRSLLKALDRMLREKGYGNRSLAISDMVRGYLFEHQLQSGDEEVAGTITLVFDHHRTQVQETLTSMQHGHLHAIISTLHVHLDHDNCLEVLVVRGKASAIRTLAEHLIAVRGVKHGKLTLSTTGKNLPG